MRRLLRLSFLLVAVLCGTLGAALLAWPQDFLVLVGAAFLGSGSAGALLLVAVAVASAWVAWRVDRDGWPPRARRALGAATLLAVLVVTGVLATENTGFAARPLRFTSDGATLAGTLITPPGAGPHPGLVIAQGSIDQPRRIFRRLAVTFAKRLGFAVLYYDRRGVGESGGRYLPGNDTRTEHLEAHARDLSAAVTALAMRPEVDSTRVGVFGMSQAGWIMPIAAAGNRFLRFALIVSGPTTSVGEENAYSNLVEVNGDHFGWNEPPMPLAEAERRAATAGASGFDPRPYLERLTIPTLWLYGGWDNAIPVGASAARVDALARAGVPIASRTFAESNHGLYVMRGPHRRVIPHFAPGVVDTVSRWLVAQGGGR